VFDLVEDVDDGDHGLPLHVLVGGLREGEALTARKVLGSVALHDWERCKKPLYTRFLY
jgi:hypothetical protein